MSESLAYLAGLVDGEGSLGLEPQLGARFRGPYVSIPSTSKSIINWLVSTYPGGQVTSRRGRRANHADAQVWKVRGDRALRLMADLRQYMQERDKAARVDLLLAEYKAVTRRNGKYSPEQLAAKLDLEQRVMALNSRGQKGLYS